MLKILEIHGDYVAGFTEARDMIVARDTPKAEVLAFLRARRRDREAERIYVDRMAEEIAKRAPKLLGNATWEGVQAFCMAAGDYAKATTTPSGFSWYTQLLDIVEGRARMGHFEPGNWNPRAISGPSATELARHIDDVLNVHLPARLEAVMAEYAVLRVKLA